MRRSRHLLSTSLATLALVAAWPEVRADSRDEDVKAYQQEVARGSAAFDAGNYAIARASFRAAYTIHAEPVLLFNIASTYRREGELDRAIVEYRAFLEIAAADDPRRLLATQTIADLEDRLAIQQRGPEATEILPDDEDDDVADGGDDETPPPALTVTHDPVPPGLYERRHRARRPGAALRWTGIGLGAGAVITGGLAVAAGLDVEQAERALESRNSGAPWNFEQQRLFDQGQQSQQRVLLWSVATVALATAGVVLYITGDRQRDRATSVTLVPSGGGASLSLSGPF